MKLPGILVVALTVSSPLVTGPLDILDKFIICWPFTYILAVVPVFTQAICAHLLAVNTVLVVYKNPSSAVAKINRPFA